jgi:hypothetical protein
MHISQKLQVEIGQHKFNAEGREDIVKEQYRLFLEAVAKSEPHSCSRSPKDRKPAPIGIPNPVLRPDGSVDFPKSDWDRVFFIDPYGYVLLRDLSRTCRELRDIDSVLLLVFGHCKIKREQTIRAPSLMYAVRGSGVPIERLDRVVAGWDHLFTTTGIKKGTRYGLTDGGLEAATATFLKRAEEDRMAEPEEC